jgi:hypothetical protein
LVAALAGNAPHPIYVEAGSDDLRGRAEHLEKMFEALQAYLAAIISECLNALCQQSAVTEGTDAIVLIKGTAIAEKMKEMNIQLCGRARWKDSRDRYDLWPSAVPGTRVMMRNERPHLSPS